VIGTDKEKVLHQVGLECSTAPKISINKKGSDMNAVFGINHSGRLTGQPYGLILSRQIENNLKS